MKRIFFKKNGTFYTFEDVTGLQHPKPKDEADLKKVALAAFEVDDELEGFEIREGDEFSPLGEPALTVKGFVEYGRVRFGLTAGQADKIRKVISGAVKARKGRFFVKPRRTARNLFENVENKDRASVEYIRQLVLASAWNALTEAQQTEILEEATKNREHFARSSTPGHLVWYPIHLQVEAFIEGLMFPGEEVKDETA